MRRSPITRFLLHAMICSLPPGCHHDDRVHGRETQVMDLSYDHLQVGDLFFQDLDCGPLCDAIEAVTHGVNGQDFSHVGLVVRTGDSLAVIEAIGVDVHLTSLQDFHARSPKVHHGRVKAVHRTLAERAADTALTFLGKPYDDAFLPGPDSLYCSELIALAYERANGGRVFEYSPMTFRDPSTGGSFPAWVDHYSALGLSIPEGIEGCNPAGLSRSRLLEE